MKRRDFITLVGGASILPLGAARAQQPKKVPRIGFLATGSLEAPETRASFDAFRQGLRELGYFDGENIVIAGNTQFGHEVSPKGFRMPVPNCAKQPTALLRASEILRVQYAIHAHVMRIRPAVLGMSVINCTFNGAYDFKDIHALPEQVRRVQVTARTPSRSSPSRPSRCAGRWCTRRVPPAGSSPSPGPRPCPHSSPR